MSGWRVLLTIRGAVRAREQLSSRLFLSLPELPRLEASSGDRQQLLELAADRQLLAAVEETLAGWQQDMANNLDGIVNRVQITRTSRLISVRQTYNGLHQALNSFHSSNLPISVSIRSVAVGTYCPRNSSRVMLQTVLFVVCFY